MNTKKTVIKKTSSVKHKKVPNKAIIQPIIEHEEHEKHESTQTASMPHNQISEMLEDIHDMIENAGHISVDFVNTITNSMTLTANLFTNVISGASECVGDLISRNGAISESFMKCNNASDFLSFGHNLFDKNYCVMNKLGVNCGDHMNGFAKGLSDILSYNTQNNWLEKFKRKKKFR